jgi:acetyl esterase/lipase
MELKDPVKALLLLLPLLGGVAWAQETVIRVYPGPAPGSEGWTQEEKENNDNSWRTRIVYNVVNPTLTVFKPAPDKANGTAVVICPGGGFHALSIDSEGFDVARALVAKGVAGFVLKYRLIETKTADPIAELFTKPREQMNAQVPPVVRMATADAKAAMILVRKRAAELGVNPSRIGVMGFSAGGSVAGSLAFTYAADSRPDFAAPIYGGYEWTLKGPVPADAPPMFILAATDDQLGLAPDSVRFYNDWTAAKKPAELHLYSRGGHGFGMRKQDLPSDRWIDLFTDWLGVQGLLKK